MRSATKKLILSTVLVVGLFCVAEILALLYSEEIAHTIQGHSKMSIVFFVLMAAVAVIIPVWSNIFLLPFGVIAWGAFITALLCILGWWIGSLISFAVARRYRELLIQKYPSLASHQFIDSLISNKHQSLSLIFLRMTIPVDVLSYALGLFSKKVSWKENAITTVLGITPFAFVFSYLGELSMNVEVIILLTTSLLFIMYIAMKRKNTIA